MPPTTRTFAPGFSRKGGSTVRKASGRLSLALASASRATSSERAPASRTANGTRTRSESAPPQFRPAAPKPYIESRGTDSQLAVSPARQRRQPAHAIWNGTMTRHPASMLRTSPPTSTTSATNSWPRAIGRGYGTAPRIIGASRSQVVATMGRTMASVADSRRGGATSRHSSLPGAHGQLSHADHP